jgi:hypothetical protein
VGPFTRFLKMAEPQDEAEIEEVIAESIYWHTRGDIEHLARSIIADLREAGFEIRRDDQPSQQNGRPMKRP